MADVSARGAGGGSRALEGYVLVRTLFGVLLLGMYWFSEGLSAKDVVPGAPAWASLLGSITAEMWGILGGHFVVLLLSAALLRRGWGRRQGFIWFQLSLDVALASALVATVDGALSTFALLYFVNIVGAAWLLPSKAPAIFSGVNGVAFLGIVALRGEDWAAHAFGTTDNDVVRAQLLVQVFALLLVGLLASLLSHSRSLAGAALARQVEVNQVLQQRQQHILDEIRTGVLIVNEAGLVTMANPWAREVLGAAVGQALGEVLQPRGERWEQRRAEGAGPAMLMCSRSPLQGGGEVVLVEDVTRLREMEAQVAREERLSAVGRYAAGLAHEIRNPLASLSGSVQLLRDEHKDPLFDIVLREVRRLNNLVEDFLDSARPVRLALTEADPGQIIGEVVATFRNDRSYETRVLRTRVRMLPSVRLDAGRFRQVIWNLLLNAAQATPDFGTIEVSAEIDEEKGLLMVRVQDDGVGIAPDALRTLFDPFYTTRAGGTGLGLANVDRVVRAHGGSVEVQSTPGEGARFTLSFPLRGPSPAAEGAKAPGSTDG